jgi:uncharacterized tellurite resistance protein B-like protein
MTYDELINLIYPLVLMSDDEVTVGFLLHGGWILLISVLLFSLRRGYSNRKISAVQRQINDSCDDLVQQSNALLAPVLPQLVEPFGNDRHFRSAVERVFGVATVTAIMNAPDFGKLKTHSSTPTLEPEAEKVPFTEVSTTATPEEINSSVLKDAVAQIIESEDVLNLITWILAERVIHADGVIDKSEQEWFQSELDLNDSDMRYAAVVANDPKALQLAVLMFNKLFPRHPKKRELLINNLFAIAVVDGELAVEEETVIRKIATMIKMKEETYQSIFDAMRGKTGESNPSILLAEDIFDELDDLGDFEDESV